MTYEPPPYPGPPAGSGWGAPPPGGPGYYGAPGGYGPQPQQSQKAMWSMILGIISLALLPLCCGLFGFGAIPAIVAIVMGTQSKREIADAAGALTGAGQAQAGFIMGIIGAVLSLLFAVFFVGMFVLPM